MNPSSDKACKKADDLYRNRANIASVEESITILLECKGSDGDYDIQWRLSRAYFFLGQESSDKAEKIVHFREGISTGELAVGLDAHRVEGHFWFAVNLSLCAEQIGRLTALRYIRQALKHLEISRTISPGYHGAGPLRISGRLRHKLPWPLGSRTLSESLYRQALQLSPENSVTRVFLCDLLHDLDQRNVEEQELAKILELPDDPEWQFEIARDKQIAADRIESLRHN